MIEFDFVFLSLNKFKTIDFDSNEAIVLIEFLITDIYTILNQRNFE